MGSAIGTMAPAAAGAIALDVPFADVRAADLRLSIGGAVPAMLASVLIDPRSSAAGFAPAQPLLTLGILGSSHVAFVGDAEAPEHVEELSCTAPGGVPLHAAGRTPHAPAIRVEKLGEEGFGSVVTRMRGLCDDPSALVAEFPGADGAITAVRGDAVPGGYRWWTWHLYPDDAGGGEVVATESIWRKGAER